MPPAGFEPARPRVEAVVPFQIGAEAKGVWLPWCEPHPGEGVLPAGLEPAKIGLKALLLGPLCIWQREEYPTWESNPPRPVCDTGAFPVGLSGVDAPSG